jgi:hypothetical protein
VTIARQNMSHFQTFMSTGEGAKQDNAYVRPQCFHLATLDSDVDDLPPDDGEGRACAQGDSFSIIFAIRSTA